MSCYREVNGVYFVKAEHRGDCTDPDCRGCRPCPDAHCTSRKSCAVHVSEGEISCPRCIGRTRADIRWIVNLVALMPIEALSRGVNSEPASLAGPAGDPLVLSWRRINQSRETGQPIGDGSDETDPTGVLGIWQAMLSEDYGHELPDRITLSTSADYLDRNLARIANDPEQDWALMAREIRNCRRHLEAVLRNGTAPEKGAPCPECEAPKPRLSKRYGHWCLDPDCTKVHFDDDTADVWVCPKDRGHRWSEYDYRLRVADWYDETTGASA